MGASGSAPAFSAWRLELPVSVSEAAASVSEAVVSVSEWEGVASTLIQGSASGWAGSR
jgi:hypothetical protein